MYCIQGGHGSHARESAGPWGSSPAGGASLSASGGPSCGSFLGKPSPPRALRSPTSARLQGLVLRPKGPTWDSPFPSCLLPRLPHGCQASTRGPRCVAATGLGPGGAAELGSCRRFKAGFLGALWPHPGLQPWAPRGRGWCCARCSRDARVCAAPWELGSGCFARTWSRVALGLTHPQVWGRPQPVGGRFLQLLDKNGAQRQAENRSPRAARNSPGSRHSQCSSRLTRAGF